MTDRRGFLTEPPAAAPPENTMNQFPFAAEAAGLSPADREDFAGFVASRYARTHPSADALLAGFRARRRRRGAA
jgi:hypothetical protein